MGVQAAGRQSFNPREPRPGVLPRPAAPAAAPGAGAAPAGKGRCASVQGGDSNPGGWRPPPRAPAAAAEVGTDQ